MEVSFLFFILTAEAPAKNFFISIFFFIPKEKQMRKNNFFYTFHDVRWDENLWSHYEVWREKWEGERKTISLIHIKIIPRRENLKKKCWEGWRNNHGMMVCLENINCHYKRKLYTLTDLTKAKSLRRNQGKVCKLVWVENGHNPLEWQFW